MYKFKKSIVKDSLCYKQAGDRNGLPTGIVIHGTGCENPWLKRWVIGDGVEIGFNPNYNYYGGKNNRICTPHAAAGLTDDGEICIVQVLPYEKKCWCCGAGKNGSYNQTHIQIEISQCIARGEKYCKDIFRAVAEWCADLCVQYKIDVDDIVSHKEAHALGYANNHGDPENWLEEFDLSMNWFRDLVRVYLADREGKTPDKSANWVVQLGAFSIKQNAVNYAADLKKKYGLECFVTERKP